MIVADELENEFGPFQLYEYVPVPPFAITEIDPSLAPNTEISATVAMTSIGKGSEILKIGVGNELPFT